MAHPASDGGTGRVPPLVIRILEWPVRLGGMISTLLILVAFALVVFAVFQRYVLDTPLKWGDEMLGYLLVAIVMSGAAEALRRGDHIAIDLVADRVSGRARTIIDVIGNLAVLVFSAILMLSADEAVRFAYSFGSYSPGYLEAPMWIPQSALIVGSALLGLAALARLLARLAPGARA